MDAMRQIFLLLLLLLFSQGCAASGGLMHFHGSGELLEIKMDTHLRSKMSYLEASGSGGLFCSGSSYPQHKRSPWFFGCSGDEGRFTLACNDGRHLLGRWSAESCSEGQGLGGDQFGNSFVFAYGESDADVRRKVGLALEGKQPPFAGFGQSGGDAGSVVRVIVQEPRPD